MIIIWSCKRLYLCRYWDQQGAIGEVEHYVAMPKLVSGIEIDVKEIDKNHDVIYMGGIDKWFYKNIFWVVQQEQCRFAQASSRWRQEVWSQVVERSRTKWRKRRRREELKAT